MNHTKVMSPLWPESLRSGDAVALVSPAGWIEPRLVHMAERLLMSWGFQVKLGANVLEHQGIYAGDPEQRLADFRWALENEEIKAIICTRGGYGAVHLLEHLSGDVIQGHPKWLVGFSDITALHTCFSKNNLVSLHGTMPKNFAVEGSEISLESLHSMLLGDQDSYHTSSHFLNVPGNCKGRLLGGNLSVLYGLRGTPWDLDWDGAILYLEDLNEELYHIDRMLQNFRLGGKLKSLAGVVLGHFSGIKGEADYGQTICDFLYSFFSHLEVPVVFGFPGGHKEPNFTLPLGAEVELEVTARGASIYWK